MKKILFLFPVLMLTVGVVSAQDNVKVRVTNTDDVNVLISSGRFLFPAFQNAEVFFRGEGIIKAKMNYNYLMDEMMFIDEKGDTLAIAEPDKVVYILLDTRVFKHHASKGFMEVIGSDLINDAELLLKRTILQGDKRKYGAYGTTTSATGSVELVQRIGANQLSTSEEVNFIKKNDFYLLSDDKYKAANRSGFLSTYANHKKEIAEYLKQNPVDYKSVGELQRLFVYCAQK